MQMMIIAEPKPEEFLVIRPLSYVVELCGWAQARAARQENLESLHVTFLRRAAWNGMVSFDRIRKETGLPRYSISRAAKALRKRKFGEVKPDPEDKRWQRLHITLLGLKCCERIDLKIVRDLITQLRPEEVTSYYTFASHIWNAARCLPDSSQVVGGWGFPGAITGVSDLNARQKQQQEQLISFLQDFKESRRFWRIGDKHLSGSASNRLRRVLRPAQSPVLTNSRRATWERNRSSCRRRCLIYVGVK